MEVPADVGAVARSSGQGPQVPREEVDASRIVDLRVEAGAVEAREPVLGDDDRQLVPLVQEARAPVERFGLDGPAEGVAWRFAKEQSLKV